MIRSYKDSRPTIALSAYVDESAQIIGDVEIGEDSSIWFNCVVRGDVNFVRIGEKTNIQDGSIIHVTGKKSPAIIGDFVTVGHGVNLHGCTVRGRSLIGIGAIILDDALIGEGSIIAAGSLVVRGTKVPPRSFMLGVPARVVREVTDKEQAMIAENWMHYVEYKNIYLNDSGG